MNLLLRDAIPEDAVDIYAWRLDPDTMRASENESDITWAEHSAWYSKSLQLGSRTMYVGELSGVRMGICRFDQSKSFSTVSINLNPDYRGLGWGLIFLHACLDKYSKTSTDVVRASIHEDNKASLNIFLKCNFEIDGRRGAFLQLVRK